MVTTEKPWRGFASALPTSLIWAILREGTDRTMKETMLFEWANSIIESDANDCLAQFPDDSIDCIVTSPPYYQQRDYSTAIQIGNEPTAEQYITRLKEVFAQALRILKPTGTLWLNLGDKYDKGELLGLPWRVAFALKDVGWLLRSDIIWHKPNAVPSSVKNRPTTDHEYVFLFAKSPDYFYDIDSIREPHVTFGPGQQNERGTEPLREGGGNAGKRKKRR